MLLSFFYIYTGAGSSKVFTSVMIFTKLDPFRTSASMRFFLPLSKKRCCFEVFMLYKWKDEGRKKKKKSGHVLVWAVQVDTSSYFPGICCRVVCSRVWPAVVLKKWRGRSKSRKMPWGTYCSSFALSSPLLPSPILSFPLHSSPLLFPSLLYSLVLSSPLFSSPLPLSLSCAGIQCCMGKARENRQVSR